MKGNTWTEFFLLSWYYLERAWCCHWLEQELRHRKAKAARISRVGCRREENYRGILLQSVGGFQFHRPLHAAHKKWSIDRKRTLREPVEKLFSYEGLEIDHMAKKWIPLISLIHWSLSWDSTVSVERKIITEGSPSPPIEWINKS